MIAMIVPWDMFNVKLYRFSLFLPFPNSQLACFIFTELKVLQQALETLEKFLGKSFFTRECGRYDDCDMTTTCCKFVRCVRNGWSRESSSHLVLLCSVESKQKLYTEENVVVLLRFSFRNTFLILVFVIPQWFVRLPKNFLLLVLCAKNVHKISRRAERSK